MAWVFGYILRPHGQNMFCHFADKGTPTHVPHTQ
jgi:hypothetical protein